MQEEVKKQKISFFKKVVKAIKDFDKYGEFAAEKTGESVKYFFKVMLIFSIILAAVFTYRTITVINEGIEYVKNSFPEFTFANNELKFETDKPLIFEDEKQIVGCIIIDTNIDSGSIEEYNKKAKLYESSIIILKDKIIFANNMIDGQTVFNYSEITEKYGIPDFNKEFAVKTVAESSIKIFSAIFGSIFIYVFIIYILRILLDVVLLAILAYFVARIVRMKIIFRATFNMAIYALTLPIILSVIYLSINTLTGFVVSGFQWMYTSISYIYIIVAVLMIKTDLINTQIELTKIAAVQEQVRKEMEEEQEKEKKEEDKKEEDKKEEDKKDNEKEEGNPEGSKA